MDILINGESRETMDGIPKQWTPNRKTIWFNTHLIFNDILDFIIGFTIKCLMQMNKFLFASKTFPRFIHFGSTFRAPLSLCAIQILILN